LRLISIIRYGTERYPEKVARRLRLLNITTWIVSAVASGFATVQFLDPTPGLWRVAAINALAALVCPAIPLLHRFGPLAAALVLFIIGYVYFFFVIVLLGTGTGMQFYYLMATAFVVLFFGIEHIFLASAFGIVAAALIIASQVLVPYNTGLQPATTQFGDFIAIVVISCAVLFSIIFYALREAARAEAAAERERERSDILLANILPASVASQLKSRTESVIAPDLARIKVLARGERGREWGNA
jgi:adenylate cyclase